MGTVAHKYLNPLKLHMEMERAEMAMNGDAVVRYQKALCVHGYRVFQGDMGSFN